MQTKNIAIIVSVIVGIAISSAIVLGINTVDDTVDKFAVNADTVDVLLQNKEHVFVVDIRTAKQYQSGHINGASHDVLDSATLEKRVKTIQNRLPEVVYTYNLVLVDNDGMQAKQIAQTMTEMGIQTFYLDGGMSSWDGDLMTSSQTVIDSEELMQKLDANEDIFLLDVREPDELLESKINGTVEYCIVNGSTTDFMVTAYTDLGYDVGPCEELLVYFDASSPGGASEVWLYRNL